MSRCGSIYGPNTTDLTPSRLQASASTRITNNCTIVVLLPSKPVDLYVEGTLIKAGVYDKLEMVTPRLAAGSYKYVMEIRDSTDKSKTRKKTVTGIIAGGRVEVDLKELVAAS